MSRSLNKTSLIGVLLTTALTFAPTSYGAPWLYVGPLYYKAGGFLEWRFNTTTTEVTDLFGNQSFESSHSNILHSNYGLNLNQQSRGYFNKPWIAKFTVDASVDNQVSDFHTLEDATFTSRGSINASTHFFPYNHYDSILTIGYTPILSYSDTNGANISESSHLAFTQNYKAASHNGTYLGTYNLSKDQDTLALSGNQFLERNALSQRVNIQRTQVAGEAKTNDSSSAYLKHSFRPEYSGVVLSNVVSTVAINPAIESYSGPLPVVINSNLSYMYDTEYVDTNTVPSISGGISLVLDRAEILPPQISANANVGWPMWRQLKMSTQLGYSAYGDSTSTTLSQQVRRQFKSKVVGQIKYERHLQASAKNIWANDNNQFSWQIGGGHAIRYPQVYEMLQPISVGITQNFSLSGNTNETLQGGNLTHSAVLSTTRNDITISSSLSDTRAYQFASNASTAVQSAQLSLAKPIISSAYVSSNAKFNLQWQQRQTANEDVTTQSANLQYRYDSRRIANVRNLSGNYSVTGKLDDSGSELSANGAINYRIGAVEVAGKSSITLFNAKRFSAELNIKRFF